MMKVDCHAVQAPLAMTEKADFLYKILGVALGLCVIVKIWG